MRFEDYHMSTTVIGRILIQIFCTWDWVTCQRSYDVPLRGLEPDSLKSTPKRQLSCYYHWGAVPLLFLIEKGGCIFGYVSAKSLVKLSPAFTFPIALLSFAAIEWATTQLCSAPLDPSGQSLLSCGLHKMYSHILVLCPWSRLCLQVLIQWDDLYMCHIYICYFQFYTPSNTAEHWVCLFI